MTSNQNRHFNSKNFCIADSSFLAFHLWAIYKNKKNTYVNINLDDILFTKIFLNRYFYYYYDFDFRPCHLGSSIQNNKTTLNSKKKKKRIISQFIFSFKNGCGSNSNKKSLNYFCCNWTTPEAYSSKITLLTCVAVVIKTIFIDSSRFFLSHNDDGQRPFNYFLHEKRKHENLFAKVLLLFRELPIQAKKKTWTYLDNEEEKSNPATSSITGYYKGYEFGDTSFYGISQEFLPIATPAAGNVQINFFVVVIERRSYVVNRRRQLLSKTTILWFCISSSKFNSKTYIFSIKIVSRSSSLLWKEVRDQEELRSTQCINEKTDARFISIFSFSPKLVVFKEEENHHHPILFVVSSGRSRKNSSTTALTLFPLFFVVAHHHPSVFLLFHRNCCCFCSSRCTRRRHTTKTTSTDQHKQKYHSSPQEWQHQQKKRLPFKFFENRNNHYLSLLLLLVCNNNTTNHQKEKKQRHNHQRDNTATEVEKKKEPRLRRNNHRRNFCAKNFVLFLFFLLFCVPSSLLSVVAAHHDNNNYNYNNNQEEAFQFNQLFYSQSQDNNPSGDCCLCPWITAKSQLQAFAFTTFLCLLFVTSAATMFKVSKSYSKKSEHKREATGAAGSDYHHIQSNGGTGPFITSPPPSVRNGSIRNESNYQQQQQQAHHQQSSQQQHRSSSASRGGRMGGDHSSESHYVRGGQVVPVSGGDRYYDSALSYSHAGAQAQGYSESSTYETREHYEKKIRKKTRGERERSRSRTNGLHASNGSLSGKKDNLESSKFQGNLDDIISRLTRGIGIVNEKLDLILRRIEEVEGRADTADPAEIRRAVQELVEDLEAIEAPINDLFDDVDILKSHNHPRTDEFYRQVYGLHQRRTAYLDRLNNQILTRIGIRTDTMSRRTEERTKSLFHNLEEAIRWVREKSEKLDSMVFHEDLETLEEVFEQHKIDNRDIQDFDQTVKECIARQAEISAEESHEYCELLAILESEYQQLRDLSAGRMLDLDSLIAFIRAAQLELIWIHEREDIEVTRNWSNIERLDLPMLQNYFKQLLHEIELREKRFNDVHNQGAALLNQRHPAVEVIEIYLRSLQNQWDWLLGLTKCLEGHLRDALNLKSFQEEVAVIEEWIKSQTEHLENNYNQTNFSVEEGERWLRELNEIREVIQRYHNLLMTLAERSAQISPLWQRGERIRQPIPVTAWCDYKGKDIEIRAGDEVTLIDNSDLINWVVRGVDGVQATVPSVVFRIPPPDPQLTNHLARLAAQLDKMRKLWDRKHRMIRFNMMISTMKSIQGWDLDTFLSYPPEQRDEIIKALNDDVNKLLAEMDPNDPLALRLKEELRRTNDHFLDLLNQSLRGPESDLSSQFDERLAELLKKLEEAWKKLNERTAEGVPKTVEDLERLVNDHRAFEEALQNLDSEVSNVKELFRQIPNPTPQQRANHDYLNSRWEDIWDLSRMYVERLKILQQVLQGIDEVTDIVRRHEVTLSSFDDMPSALDSLRGVHAQLLELNMVLQQQEHIIHQLNKNTAQLRQHVARTRFNVASHPDVDRLEEQVQQLTVRWDNVCSQVTDRLKVAEESQQTQMVYRSQYDEEIQWLDRVENTINKLRKPETLSPDELQQQLEQLMAEYRQLQEHTATIENINKEGGKFIREAKNYDNSLNTFREHITTIHGPGIRNEFRRTHPQPKNGAQIVTEELEALNRRFAELSSVILERRNQLNILIQNWKRKQQDTFQAKCVDQTIYINRILNEINELPNIRQIELDFSSPDSATDARIELLKVKENLAAYGATIEQNLREADRLCIDGAEILTPEQFHALKEGREKLQNTYRNLIEYTDKILKRLDVATALLIEFSTKSSEFHSWIFAKSRELEGTRLRSGDPSRLTESKREAKQLYDDIIANGDKLREIRQLAVKIESEVRNYIEELKRQDPHAKLPPLHAQDVQNTVQLIQEDYEKLIHDSQLLIQFLNKLNSLSVDHDHNLQEVDQWLADLEASTSSIVDARNSAPDEKLNVLLNLSQEAIAKQPKIDEAIRSANDLIAATVSTDAHDALAKEQEMNLGEIQRRFKNINNKINDSVDATRAEIARKDGVNQGIENLLDWISSAEKDVGNSQSLPLIPEKLSNLKYEDQLKRSEMHSQEKILADIGKQIENLLANSPSSEATQELGNKFADAEQRFKRVKSIRKGLSDNLHEVIDALNDLNAKNNGINKKLSQFQDDLDRIDATDETGIQNLQYDLSQIVDGDWKELEGLAKRILFFPNISETDGLNEMMNGTSKGLNRAQKRLADKVNAGNRLATDKNAFNNKAAEIEAELSEIEGNIQYQIVDVSVDDEVIQQKLEACKEIEQKLVKTRDDLEELERIEMDLIHASGANKRRSVILDGSPLASATTAAFENINQAKQQLSALQKRQDEAERVLHKLVGNLDETLDKRSQWNAKCDELQRWLGNENSQLANRQNLTLDNLSLQTTTKEIKAANKRLREKNPELTEFQQLSIHLIKKLPPEGHEDEIVPIQNIQKAFVDNFDSLENDNASLELCVATANVFLADSTSMDKWITSKQKVLNLCAVSADPNLISNHLALLDVLKNEIEDEKPKWQNLNETSDHLQKLSKSNSFNNEVSDKMDNLNNKWKNLEDAVNTRVQDLNAAKSLDSEFNNAQKDFNKKLGELDAAIDDITKAPINSDADIENQNKRIEEVEKKLEAELEPLLDDLTKLASEIEEITNDPATKSEAKNRLDSAKTAVDELKKKLDSVKKAAANAKSQGEELLSEFDKKLDWIRETQKDFDSMPPVSADPAKLNEQIEDFSKLYSEVLENEGSMVLARAKIADALQKKPNSMLKRKLESFDEEWKPLLTGVKDRHQLMEKAKKLGDELADLEVSIKNDLNDASQKIEEAKSADSNGNEMPDLTPTEDLLHSLRPSLDGLLSLARNLEQIAPGPDAKKLNREAENLVAEANNLTKECGNQLKLAKARNDLRNQFEKGVIATQMLLDNARNNSGISDQQDSTDSVTAKPALSKEKLKLLMDDLDSNWIRQRRDLDSTANKLKPMIDTNEIEQIDDALTDLDLSYNELKEQFGLASSEMQETESAIGSTAEKGRQLKDEVDELVDRIRELGAIGRDSETLKEQSDECDAMIEEIEDKKQRLEQLAIEWKKLVDSGKVSSNQMIGPQKEMDQMNNKLDQQKAKMTKRKGEIEDMAFNVDKLTSDAKDLIAKINDFTDEEIFKQPVASELDDLRRQQNAIKQLKTDSLKPLLEETDNITEQCKDLIRSAGPGIPTSELEDTLKSLGDAINDINSKVEERDRTIDSAIQGLGSYNDAYKALLNWIEEIEDLVANQKPPSADYKVARAQLQNHDFQLKLIDDKQNSVDGFLAMIGKVEALTNDEKTKAALRAKADDISTRYNDLVEGANQRRLNLLDAAQLGEEYANIVKPLSEWIEAVNRELQQLTSVPTNKDKLLEQINSQENLLHVIGEKAPEVDKLVVIYSELIKLVGPDDAAELEATVQDITEKYNNLGKRCENIGNTLRGMTESITNFLEDADHLAQWIENAEKEIERFGEMSIYPEELAAQSEALVNLVSAVTEQQDLVSRVVSDSNELCMHTSGAEAVALQYRIDNLRQRYGQISNETEQKINAMTEAIPLSEEIQAGFEDISNFVDGCEEDLENLDKLPLEEQSELVSQIEADMVNMRMELEALNDKSIQLQHLSSKQKADELAKRTNELNRAFENVNQKALRKADMLSLAERQSKQVFDDLDFALDWFREAHDTILSSEKPAIDTERLKTQLKNQSLMNKDIAEQKANLRNIIAQATKVARELRSTLGGEEVALATKMETARRLADATADLGHTRLADLEQALALCTELDDSFTDITEWLDIKDEELRSCEPINTGMSPEQLLSHKQHNNQMLQAYRDQYPIIAKFDRNVKNLAELCSAEDAQNLDEIASGTIDRFKQQEEEFRERGRILDSTIEQSSQFTDRLDSFLSNLESATNKLRNPEPVSARPPLLKRQIDDNSEILALLHQKEGHYQAMKEDARALLAQTQPGDPTAEEVRNKIHALEGLWSEIHDGLNRRNSFLHDTLAKAERFWSELENCQRAVDGLKRNLDSIQLTSADPQMLDENKAKLNDVGYGIDATKPAIDCLRLATDNLIANVGEEGKYDVERNMVNLENDWATVTAIYAQMSNNLVDAISRSMDFHELLQQLLAWLVGAEEQIAALPTATLSDPMQIKAELDRISALRVDVDKHSMLKEQLNRAADELFRNANPSQVNAIRAPITDLNNRWNKLYAALNDRQQKLERALLEMGQFEQARAQLEAWMDKTDITLDEIQPNTKDLKHIEIELCKLKVIQNDIQSHVPSFEAINKAGKALIAAEPHTASITQPKLDNLVDKWHSLTDKSEQLWTKLEISKNDASNRDGELDHWGLWLEDLLSELSHNKPIGGLPETAQSQLDDFYIIKADVEEKRGKFEAELKRILEQIEAAPGGDSDNKSMQERYNEMRKNWTRVNEKLVDRQKKLEIALEDAINLNNDMQSMTRWLDNAENYLSNLPQISRLPDALKKQMDNHLAFVDKVANQREAMSDLNTRGSKIQFTCEKKDAIPIKNRLISLKHRFDKIVNRTADRTKSYENAMGESETYFNARNELVKFLDEADKELQRHSGLPSDSATGERIRETLEEHKKLQEELHSRKPQYETTNKRGKTLEDHAPVGEKSQVHEANEELTRKWKHMNQEAIQRQRSLEDALVQSGKFDEAFAEVSKWLNKTLPKLEDEVALDKSQGDLETLTQIYEEHTNLMDEIKRRKDGVESLKNRAEKILESPETSEKDKDDIRSDLDKLNDQWQRLEDASKIRENQLSEGLKNAVDLAEMTHELEDQARHKEGCLRRFGTLLPEDEPETLQLLEKLKDFAAEIRDKDRPEIDKALELGNDLLEKCHPAAEESLRKMLRALSGKWDQIEESTKDKIDKVNKHLDELREHDQKLSDLKAFIEDKEATLENKDNEKDAATIPQVETLLAANDLFKADLNEKQPEVDEIMKAAKKVAAKTEPSIDAISSPDSPTSPSPKKPPLTRGSTKLKLLQQPEKQRKSKRQQKTDAIAEKWRKLWDHTQAYDAKLKQRKEYLAEMKRLENFTFNEWRERYLAFTDHAKARISDLFRRIDTTGTGIVPRQDFINGILNTKFPTTPLEMARVADEFDKGDGKISAKEFMNALRYDPKKRPPPKTESEMIHEELRKETERCTCARRFPITHISTNDNKVQYGFGFGSTMKRMVRILRSTVMVRVGGGWEKLDEFLVKHDPCRAAGRLNLHIHNTPENAQDQMHEFTPKPRRSELRDVLTYADGTTPGPISKVREKTERSIPMFKKPYPKTSTSRDSPISYSSRRSSDVNFGDSKIPRPSPSISRSGSRQNLSNTNSRPPSRMSDEEERPPSRIPSIRAPKGTPRFGTGGAAASSSSRTSPHP